MTATDSAPGDAPGTKRPPWLFWLLGLGGVIAVVGAAVKYSDAVAFAQIVQRARPWWLAIAAVLQLATYVVQGELWRAMGRRADTRISVVAAAELSLARLFVDQALPSGGLSGAVMIAQALQHRGMTEAAAIATAVVDVVSYYLAFLIALATAVALAAVTGHASALIIVSAIAVAAFAIVVVATILTIAGGCPPRRGCSGESGSCGEVSMSCAKPTGGWSTRDARASSRHSFSSGSSCSMPPRSSRSFTRWDPTHRSPACSRATSSRRCSACSASCRAAWARLKQRR